MHNFLISDTAVLQFDRVQLWSKEYVGEHPHFESDLENGVKMLEDINFTQTST